MGKGLWHADVCELGLCMGSAGTVSLFWSKLDILMHSDFIQVSNELAQKMDACITV